MKDPKTKMDIETPYEKLKDNEKRQLGKNNEAKMILYNALPRKEYERVLCAKPPRRGQTSNDSVCQDGSDEDEDEDEDEEEEFNSIVRNLWKLFKKDNMFEREKRFANGGDRFDRGRGGRSKGVGSSRQECSFYGCGSKKHFVDDCPRETGKKGVHWWSLE
nr:zf-CCHC domain-containing protein/DUF4219 domain-containing protein/UBN2 domain-containing protein [Tanacetum cinerariifolium]